jgi:hypothetical protein
MWGSNSLSCQVSVYKLLSDNIKSFSGTLHSAFHWSKHMTYAEIATAIANVIRKRTYAG